MMGDRLADLYHRIFRYASEDAEVALALARRYAEAFCIELLQQGRGPSIVRRPKSLEDLLKELHSRNLLSPTLLPLLRSIQSYGNMSSHEHESGPLDLSESDVRPCLDAIVGLHARIQSTRAERILAGQVAVPGKPAEMRVASSRLTVIRAIELAWRIEEELKRGGFSTRMLSFPWSDRLLEELCSGRLDLAIYNKHRTKKFISKCIEPPQILGSFGFSMGGKNFYILAREDSRWASEPREGLETRLRDVTIAVPYGSDIADNVELALRADQAELHARGIHLMNMPASSGLEIFQMGENVLVSAGQNLRVLARFMGGYHEIIGYDSLDPPLQAELLNRSENCLVASARANSDLMSAGLGNLFKRLRDNFLIEWTDPEAQQRLLRTLSSLVELDGVTVEIAERIACAIIYETYRIGRP
jgi:hypothetical protein